MNIIKPPPLRRGDVIGICAPASAPEKDHSLQQGIRYLEQLGYVVKLGNNIHRKHGYLAGSDMHRASDVHDLFADRQVKAIFAARGGYGSHRILPLLDYQTIKRNPKILVGYSDITALQLAILMKTGLLSFSGPMVASDMGKKFTGVAEEWFWRCVTSTKKLPSLPSKKNFIGAVKKKISSGRLIGGNLSILAALVGTPYVPSLNNSILLLEEIDERPYRIDRLLQQLKLGGVLAQSRGAVLGTFVNCLPAKGKSSLTLREVFRETFSNYSYPILSGIRYGHVQNPMTMPIGAMIRLDAEQKRVVFLESCLSHS